MRIVILYIKIIEIIHVRWEIKNQRIKIKNQKFLVLRLKKKIIISHIYLIKIIIQTKIIMEILALEMNI